MSRRHIFTERQRAALFDLPTDELSLLKFYTLGDDDWKTLGSAADRKTGLALPCNFVPYDIRAVHWRSRVKSFPSSVLSLEFRLMRFSLMPHGAKPVSSTWTRCAKFTATRPSRAVVPVICGVDFRPGRRCQIKRGSCSSFYCAVSGNFHHSARSIDNRALVRGCSGRR